MDGGPDARGLRDGFRKDALGDAEGAAEAGTFGFRFGRRLLPDEHVDERAHEQSKGPGVAARVASAARRDRCRRLRVGRDQRSS